MKTEVLRFNFNRDGSSEAVENGQYVRASDYDAAIRVLNDIVEFFDAYVTTLPDRNGREMLDVDFTLDEARELLTQPGVWREEAP
jgi:hypothetical protein